jgi:hypothetical protein
LRDPIARIGETDIASGSDGPPLGKPEMSFAHPVLGPMMLQLQIKEFDWPVTSRLGAHKEAGRCKEEVDWQKGAGFRLTLQRGKQAVVLNDDKTIPASRFCVTGYGSLQFRPTIGRTAR